MKVLYLVLLIVISGNTFAYNNNWNGTYHYYGSEKLLGDNVATREVILILTSEKCIFSIFGFQMDKTYSCKVEEKNNDLYLFDANSHEKFGKITFRKGNYYLYSHYVIDGRKNFFFKDK
ncbi:hypothetical protein [Acinetobacter seifertii]|uniref:Uncharacterized protein n=1 Tax=Acinetobacter seifertii TaxID=1530123 RepID=A0A7H2V795_9GAMM|nr:hypothetical protein [Acinetobacter seifertii]MBZ6533222.1 hypothetical protein [Acinetobacter seifertii]QNX72228.1 hypothetical protein IC776_17800 [Acinetobacter seifertii]